MGFRNVLTLGDGGGIKRIQLPTTECDDKIPAKSIGRSSWEDLGRLPGGGDLCADYGWDRESDREGEAAQCGGWHERHDFRALGGRGGGQPFFSWIHHEVRMVLKANHGPSHCLTFGS